MVEKHLVCNCEESPRKEEIPCSCQSICPGWRCYSYTKILYNSEIELEILGTTFVSNQLLSVRLF